MSYFDNKPVSKEEVASDIAQEDQPYAVIEDINGKKYILENHHVYMSMLMEFMRMVVYKKYLYFDEAVTRQGIRRKYTSELGRHLSKLDLYASMFVTGYQYHPLVRLFFDWYRGHLISQCTGLRPHMIAADGNPVCKVFDDFIDGIRKSETLPAVKKQIADWESKLKKNHLRSLELTSRLFDKHSRLTVIRLDLHHKTPPLTQEDVMALRERLALKKASDARAFSQGADIQKFKPIEGWSSFEALNNDRKKFFDNMRGKPSLFKHLVGYIWRIEFGLDAGYHVHVVLFYDGSKVHKHAWLAQLIGEWWVKDVTRNRGRFHNANKEWSESHPQYGIGVIDHDNHLRRKNLEQHVLKYLCKPKQGVYVLPYRGANTFGSSNMPPNHSGLGRPRKKAGKPATNQLSTADKRHPKSSLSFKIKDLARTSNLESGVCPSGGEAGGGGE